MDNTELVATTYNKLASQYDRTYKHESVDSSRLQSFLTKIPKESPILEVGCGPATYTDILVGTNNPVTAIDLSSEMVVLAKKNVPKATYGVMDMRFLTYPPNSFLAIVAMYSLIHVPEKDVITTLQGFAKVLKPKGLLFMSTQKGAPDHIIDEPLDKSQKTFVNFFTQDRLSAALHVAGFESIVFDEVAYEDPDHLTDAIIYTTATKAG